MPKTSTPFCTPLRTRAFHIFLLFLVFFSSDCDTPPPPVHAPYLVILGEDLSGTFTEFPAITQDVLADICKSVTHSGAGGAVYCIGIGSSTPKGYASCIIDAFPPRPRNATVSILNNWKHEVQEIKQRNQDAIDRFTNQAIQAISDKKQPYTDLNGFFKKVASIADDPGYQGYEKWLFVNSDGQQDTPESKTLNCDLLPAVNRFYSTVGWKEKTDCGPKAHLLDPGQFSQYFRKSLKKIPPPKPQ